jgi:hypothetical protein
MVTGLPAGLGLVGDSNILLTSSVGDSGCRSQTKAVSVPFRLLPRLPPLGGAFLSAHITGVGKHPMVAGGLTGDMAAMAAPGNANGALTGDMVPVEGTASSTPVS